MENLKDENWFDLLTKYTPKNDTDSITKQICLQSRKIHTEILYNIPSINLELEDYPIYFQELFRIFFVGEKLGLENNIISSLDERIGNCGIANLLLAG